MIKKVDYKIVLFILMLFIVFVPNVSKAVKVSVSQVKSVSVSQQETTKVKVKWKKVSKATGYRVYVYNYSTNKYKYYGETKSISMTVKKLKSSTTYKVKVRAYKRIGRKRYYGKYSSEKQFVTRPGTVSGTKVTSRTNDSLTIKWNKVARAKGYQVYARQVSSKKFKCYGSTSKDTFTIKNLRYAEEYVIMVKAYKNLNGKKLFSKDYKSINTITAPNKLSNVKISNDNKSTIRISWNKLARVTGYRIYKYNSSKKKWDILVTTNSTSVQIKNLKIGIEYQIRVRGYIEYKKTKYEGAFTNIKNTIYPAKVKNLKVTYVNTKKMSLKWDKVELATGYDVFIYSQTTKKEYLHTSTKLITADLEDLEPKKYYRVYVRAFTQVNGKKVYGEKSNIVKTAIDVSYHNGKIDWKKVKDSGIDFVILRLGWIGNKENHTLDKNFIEYYNECKKLGMGIGIYVFNYCESEEAAKSGAKWVLNQLKILKIKTVDLPIFIDMEDDRNDLHKLGKEKLTKICVSFNTIIQKANFKAGVYASKSWFYNYLNASELEKKYYIWLANYGTSTEYTGEYVMWQYTDVGKVDGISGNVDINILYF